MSKETLEEMRERLANDLSSCVSPKGAFQYGFDVAVTESQKRASEREQRLVEGLQEFYLGHEHAPELEHCRPMGDTYGWCSYCGEKVSWGPGRAEQIVAEYHRLKGESDG